MSRGATLPGQQVAGVDHGAVGELDADRLADQVQLVHDVKHPLPGDVVLDNEIDAMTVVFTARYQDVSREMSGSHFMYSQKLWCSLLISKPEF